MSAECHYAESRVTLKIDGNIAAIPDAWECFVSKRWEDNQVKIFPVILGPQS
jgi:hypothetical protein